MSSIYPSIIFRDLLDNQPDFSELRHLEDEYVFWAIPFKVAKGGVLSTETGLKELYGDVNDYTDYMRVITGNSAFLAVWEDSYTISQDMGTSAKKYLDNKAKKTWQIGVKYKGIVMSETLQNQFTPYVGNEAFVSQQANDTVTLRFFNITENEGLLNNLIINQMRIWALPNFLTSQHVYDKNPLKDQSRVFFIIDNIDGKRIPKNNKIAYVDITFVSVNNKFNKSGASINTFIQLGGAGEPYAYPLLTNDNKIILDQQRLMPLPVTHAQIFFYGLSGFNSIAFKGRPVYNSDLADLSYYTLNIPSQMYLYKFHNYLVDQLNLKGTPENVFYWVKDATLNLVTTKNTTQSFNALYDNYQKKNVQGYLSSDDVKTKASNSQKQTYWNKDFMKLDWNFTNDNWRITGNKWFEIQAGNDTLRYVNKSTLSGQSFSLSKVANKTFANWLMFNNMLNKTVIKLPLTQTDRTLVNASSIPIIGKLWSILTFGLAGAGWNVTNEAPPVYPYFNFLMPANLYSSLVSIWIKYILNDDKTSKGNGSLGLETFYGTNNSTIGIMTGGNASTIAFCGALTHMVTMDYINKTGRGGSQTIAFSDHGQEHWSNNGYYFAVNENTNLQPANKTNDNPNYPTGTVRGYCIDFYELLALGDSSYQVKFFSLAGWNPTYNEVISDDNCVWIGTFESRAKLTENIREFRNTYQMSDPTFNFKQKFIYPRDLSPIPPAGVGAYSLNIAISPAKNICSPHYTFDEKITIHSNSNYYGFNCLLNEKDTNPTVVNFNYVTPKIGYRIDRVLIKDMYIEFQTNVNFYIKYIPIGGQSNPQNPYVIKIMNFYAVKDLVLQKLDIVINPVTKIGIGYFSIPFNAFDKSRIYKSQKIRNDTTRISMLTHDATNSQLINHGLFIKIKVDLNTRKIYVSQTNYNETFNGGHMTVRLLFDWYSGYGAGYKALVDRIDINVNFNIVEVEYIK